MFGIETILSARRMRMRKVVMIRREKTSVDEDDFRHGARECLPFAAIFEALKMQLKLWRSIGYESLTFAEGRLRS